MPEPGAETTRARRPAMLTFVVDSVAYGGAEAYVLHLLRHLPAEIARSVVATDSLPPRVSREVGELGVPLVRVPPIRHKLDLKRLLRQLGAVRATEPELVHLNLTTAGNNRHLLGALAAGRPPAVATLHIVAPIGSRLQRRILRLAYRRLARAIAVSEETRWQLVDELGMDSRKVSVIANGVARRDPRVAPDDGGPVRVGGLGRLTRQKGFDLLVEAIRRLESNGTHVVASIGGEGVEHAALLRLAEGVPVELAGPVDDVPAFLAGLDVFCLPSRWEGLPFALLEAMMAGLPCVAAAVGDVAAAVGDAGILVPPEDVDALERSLRKLAESPAERARLGAAAHVRAAELFSVETMVESTLQVYEDALGR